MEVEVTIEQLEAEVSKQATYLQANYKHLSKRRLKQLTDELKESRSKLWSARQAKMNQVIQVAKDNNHLIV